MAGYLGNTPTEVPLSSADILDSTITSAKIANGTIALADLSATGTASASTFLRGDNSWASAGATAGQVIQVLSATDTTTRTTTSTSYVTASNTLTVSITPSSTANKIFIIVNSTYTYVPANTLRVTVYRDATNLASNAFVANHTGDKELPLSFSYLDSPNTTSAITYQVYIKTTGGTAYFNEANSVSTITCMEVKG